MGQPAGFKLNESLDMFLGRLFLLYIENWALLITYLSTFASLSMRLAALSGVMGLSTMIAIFIDFIQFLTMHVHWLYKAISKVRRWSPSLPPTWHLVLPRASLSLALPPPPPLSLLLLLLLLLLLPPSLANFFFGVLSSVGSGVVALVIIPGKEEKCFKK
jgi:hypothetical protein